MVDAIRADHDVLIVGGGVVGLACACLLRRLLRDRRVPLRIGVLEAQVPKPLAAAADTGLRVFAIAPAGRAILEASGAWQTLPAGRAAPFERMRVWQSGSTPFGAGSIGFDAAESGAAALGYIVEHDWLRLCLWSALASPTAVPVVLVTDSPPIAIAMESDAMAVELNDGTRLRARLLVGADGGDSWVRSQLGLKSTDRPYGQSAVVAHVDSERPHERTAWQCLRRVVRWRCCRWPMADRQSCGRASKRKPASLLRFRTMTSAHG